MEDLVSRTHKFLKDRGWDNLNPSDLAKSISIEAAELLEIFQWQNLSIDQTKSNTEKMERIKKEIADVFIYCLDMCVLLGIDPKEIIMQKLDHVSKKYPANAMKDRVDEIKYTEDDPYIKIKETYRKEGVN